MRLLKNGMEYKDTFDIEIAGKRYPRLSAGERKKLDFAISIVINKFLMQPVGIMFVDDADLLDEIGEEVIKVMSEENHIQIFISKVTNNQLTIKTNGRNNNAG